MKDKSLTKSITFNDFKKEILNDYKTIVISRETSLLGRKEVLVEKQNLEYLVTEKSYLKLQWPGISKR